MPDSCLAFKSQEILDLSHILAAYDKLHLVSSLLNNALGSQADRTNCRAGTGGPLMALPK